MFIKEIQDISILRLVILKKKTKKKNNITLRKVNSYNVENNLSCSMDTTGDKSN